MRGGEKAAQIVAVIPARGGSTGIARKNVLPFCGHPLLAWTIVNARQCPLIQRVFVSTEDSEIAAVARAYEAEVVDRPAELASPSAPSEAALLHACESMRQVWGDFPRSVVFLQATSPLRESRELTEALERFSLGGFDSLFSAARLEDFLLWAERNGALRSLNYDFGTRRRRQDAPNDETLWVETGSFYVFRTEHLLRTRNRLGGHIGVYEVPLWKSFEIDTPESWALCEHLMRAYGLHHALPRGTC